jgi:hypothetical protein
MKTITFEAFCQKRGIDLTPDTAEGHSEDWFETNRLPMVVRCTSCDMALSAFSARIDVETDDAYCAECAGMIEESAAGSERPNVGKLQFWPADRWSHAPEMNDRFEIVVRVSGHPEYDRIRVSLWPANGFQTRMEWGKGGDFFTNERAAIPPDVQSEVEILVVADLKNRLLTKGRSFPPA